MLSVLDVLYIKELNNGETIVYYNFDRNDFVFRLISPKEYAQYRTITMTEYEFSDAICQTALIYPEKYLFSDSKLAGMSDRISKEIIKASKIHDSLEVIEMLKQSRERLNSSFFNQCILLIKAAFPEYSFEEIELWSYDKLMLFTSRAEYVLTIRNGNDKEGRSMPVQLVCDEEALAKNVSAEKEEVAEEDLIDQGVDPILYFADKVELKRNIIDSPMITTCKWNDEEMIKNVRRQILKRRDSR